MCSVVVLYSYLPERDVFVKFDAGFVEKGRCILTHIIKLTLTMFLLIKLIHFFKKVFVSDGLCFHPIVLFAAIFTV